MLGSAKHPIDFAWFNKFNTKGAQNIKFYYHLKRKLF